MTTFEEEMAEYQTSWDEAEVKGGVLPDGDYQIRIAEARVEKSQLYDEWQLMMKYEDLATGGSVRSWDSLQQDVGISIAKSRLAKLGYEDGGIVGLKAACESEQFIDLVCDIKVKTTKGDTRDFTNVYLNRCYGKLGGEGVPEATAPADDEDIPF